jgi:HD-GYP domain-containing protein (c-di-GMP phosphodiesterase class II)
LEHDTPSAISPDLSRVMGSRLPHEIAFAAAGVALVVTAVVGLALGSRPYTWPVVSLFGALSAGGAVAWFVDRQRREIMQEIASWQSGREEAWRREEFELVATQRDLIDSLAGLVESRSNETAMHTVRVGHSAAMLASLADLDLMDSELLRLAAPMHDIGKVGIADAILKKQGKLEADEYATMKTHTTIGYKLLSRFHRPVLDISAAVAYEHHEKWDGSGYPRGLRGEEISIYGRIVAIVDVYDALTSNRVYRQAMSSEEVLDILRQGRGTHFDPELLDVFLDHAERFALLAEAYADPAPQADGEAAAVVPSVAVPV